MSAQNLTAADMRTIAGDDIEDFIKNVAGERDDQELLDIRSVAESLDANIITAWIDHSIGKRAVSGASAKPPVEELGDGYILIGQVTMHVNGCIGVVPAKRVSLDSEEGLAHIGDYLINGYENGSRTNVNTVLAHLPIKVAFKLASVIGQLYAKYGDQAHLSLIKSLAHLAVKRGETGDLLTTLVAGGVDGDKLAEVIRCTPTPWVAYPDTDIAAWAHVASWMSCKTVISLARDKYLPGDVAARYVCMRGTRDECAELRSTVIFDAQVISTCYRSEAARIHRMCRDSRTEIDNPADSRC